MTKITLQQAIRKVESFHTYLRDGSMGMRMKPTDEDIIILAAAKAFACETCKGKGWVFGEPENGTCKMENCPACAECRRVAKEGVEG